MQHVAFSMWLHSLTITFSGVIYVVACATASFLLSNASYSIIRIYTSCLPYLLTSIWVFSLRFGCCEESCREYSWTDFCLEACFQFFGVYTKEWNFWGIMATPCFPLEERLIRFSWRLCHFTFSQCVQVPTSPYPCQHLLLSVCLALSILADVKQYLTAASLICISLMPHGEYLSCAHQPFVYFAFSLKKCLFGSFAPFCNWVIYLSFLFG